MVSFESLQALNSQPTPALIADRIRQAIMDGDLPPGSQLGESQLAQRLGVSRGPVREALQRLIAEGVIEGRRSRGAFVVTLDAEDVVDVYRCRGVTERAAVSLILAGTPDAALTGLTDAVDALEHAAVGGDWRRIAEVDLAFHEQLVAASGSKRLSRMFATLLVETHMCLTALERAYPSRPDIVPQHRALVEALRAGDERLALQLVDAHMRHAVELQVGAVGAEASAG